MQFGLRLGLRGREAPVRDSRAGVALLIVLGLLALLMITGVAFTILMRIERASASNLRHTSAARQMAKGGLAYAIAALNADIGTNRYPNWPDRLYTPSGHDTGFPDNRPRLHIPEEIFFSVDEEKRYVNEVTEARVLTAEAARYLPGALRHRADVISRQIVLLLRRQMLHHQRNLMPQAVERVKIGCVVQMSRPRPHLP